MSLAEELTERHNQYCCGDCHGRNELNLMFIAAVDEAIERCAQESDKDAKCLTDKTAASVASDISTRIRALKSGAKE